MKTLEAYYRESVRFLRVAGKEYASAHPDTGRYLNRDNLELVWPDFEDILRGLGFLGARIHALLDKTQNDFYGDLVKLLWPQLVDEVPSVCLMKITPKSYILNGTRMISRGTTVASKKIVRSRVQCLFTTTQTVKVSPISLTALDTSSITPATSALTFRFSLKPGLSWNDLDLDPLRVHLVGESAITIALHELITRHCTGARITMGNSPVDEFVVNGRDAITPGGIGPDETLLPPDPRSNWAMSILTEYFIFREKFLCFDLHGINGNGLHKDRKTPSTISVTLSFDCGLPKNKPFGVENFTLFCTPAVNLFRSNLEPVAAKLTYDEYALTADHSHRASIQPHSVISVTGTNRTTGARVAYAPFANFAAAHTCAPTWRTRRQTRGRASAIVLLLGGREPVTAPPDGENISIDAWCTNGDAPRNELHEGDIAYCKAGLPDGISVTNITSPTASVLPREDDSLDVITALLGGNYRELSDARTMRAFFKAHDRSGSEGNGRRTGSIRHVSMTQTTALHCGAVLRGVCYKVELDEAAFSDLNDLHLFGQSAAAFLSLWSRMETFTELVIVCKPSGRELRWSSLETWLQKLDGACGGSVAGEDPICAPEAVFPVLPPVSAMAQHVEGHPGETDSLAKLMKKIEHEVSALNFFGTMRLFEGYYASLDIRDPFASGNILLVPDDSFLFPTSDIVAVERHENRYIIKLAFMGLTGASSPLPVHWSQVIVEKPEKAAAFLALLTVFNRRFFELFYEANKKYRLDPLPGSYSRDHLVMLIAALGGMSPNARQELAIRETNALSSLPLYAVAPRSATGLARVIATCFAIPKARVHVDRFLGYRENIPVGQQTMLGTANSFLGRNTLLGEAIVSAGSRIRLTIGPVTLQQYEHMVTQDSRECAILKEMIEGYIPSTFDYEIKLLVLAHDMLPAVLGDGKARLGFNMAFGKPANPLAVTTAAIPGRSPDDRRLSPETMLAIEESGLFDRSFGNYFEHELRALYDSAHAFAKGFSGAGNELSITSTGSGDPTVERMFQGAAFHTARVRETLDDTLSGLSERLFQREWRGFSDPLPSATIVAFSPRKGSLTGTTVLPRGTELLSKALSKSGDRAVFSTTQTVALNPISLETVVKSVDARGRGSIEFGFNVDGGISWPAVTLIRCASIFMAMHRSLLHCTACSCMRLTTLQSGTMGAARLRSDDRRTAVGAVPVLRDRVSASPRPDGRFFPAHRIQRVHAEVPFCRPVRISRMGSS
jgi:type VI secretion system protein ImpG